MDAKRPLRTLPTIHSHLYEAMAKLASDQAGFEPPTLWLLDNTLYCLSHSRPRLVQMDLAIKSVCSRVDKREDTKIFVQTLFFGFTGPSLTGSRS